MKKILLFFSLLFTIPLFGIEFHTLKPHLEHHPFNYALTPLALEGHNTDEEVMLCCHGMGGSEQNTIKLHSCGLIPHHLIGFRFPDYGSHVFNRTAKQTHFGTIEELLPLLFLMKKLVIDAGLSTLNLYGFSAGGGALVNALAILTQNRYSNRLQEIGIDFNGQRAILNAIQNGWILLECPLKSLDEILDFWGPFPPLKAVAARYRRNHLRPIDSLIHLTGLKLNVLLYFQDPDMVIFNRDDKLYIQRLCQANSRGTNIILIHDEGGHSTFHSELWKNYSSLLKPLSQK